MAVATLSSRRYTGCRGERDGPTRVGNSEAASGRILLVVSLAMKSDDLKLLIHAGNPIILIETPDEPRAVRVVRTVAEQLRCPLYEVDYGGLARCLPRLRRLSSSRERSPSAPSAT